jgi:hypothetical protein
MIKQQESYDIKSIKQAFWKTFHESGEIYFDYLGNAKENNRSTQISWQEFLEHLQQKTQTIPP